MYIIVCDMFCVLIFGSESLLVNAHALVKQVFFCSTFTCNTTALVSVHARATRNVSVLASIVPRGPANEAYVTLTTWLTSSPGRTNPWIENFAA